MEPASHSETSQGLDDDGTYGGDHFEIPTFYGLDVGDAGHMDSSGIDVLSDHFDAAIADAIGRSGFDPATDALSDGYLSDIQGITAEYLVADALNHSGDGLRYALYSDPSHPQADIAGFAPDGSLVRMLQVKATSDPWYAATGHHPGVEVVATADGYQHGMEMMGLCASDLRREIRGILSQDRDRSVL